MEGLLYVNPSLLGHFSFQSNKKINRLKCFRRLSRENLCGRFWNKETTNILTESGNHSKWHCHNTILWRSSTTDNVQLCWPWLKCLAHNLHLAVLNAMTSIGHHTAWGLRHTILCVLAYSWLKRSGKYTSRAPKWQTFINVSLKNSYILMT